MNPSAERLFESIQIGSSEREIEVALTSWLPGLRSRANHWAWWAGDVEGQYRDDATQAVALSVFVELRKKSEGSAHRSIEKTGAYWIAVADHSATAFYRSTSASWFSEISLQRRLGKIPAAVKKLQQTTGVFPSANAVADHLNSEMQRRMTDARRSGALLSAAEINASGLLEQLGALR